MLEVRDIQTYYGNIQALKNVSLRIGEGEIVTLIGANGAGKSTTLMSICGVTPPRRGAILFRGEPIQELSAEQIVKLGICQVPEGRHIFPQMSVLENLEMGAYLRSDKAAIKADIEQAFERFPILGKRRNQAGGTLSGGEQQMLAISRALLSRPALLLLDEPSLGLAPLYIKKIFQTIRELNEDHGMTILLIEQNAHHALRAAHRGYVMQHGQITMAGTGRDLLASAEVRAAYLEGGHAAA